MKDFLLPSHLSRPAVLCASPAETVLLTVPETGKIGHRRTAHRDAMRSASSQGRHCPNPIRQTPCRERRRGGMGFEAAIAPRLPLIRPAGMLELVPDTVIARLNDQPPELVWLLLLVVCFSSVLAMMRLLGAMGLTVYVAVAVIAANVQVLKPVQFSVFADPVALGTIVFASTYLCTDILAEHYGPGAARRAVLLGFAGYLVWTLLMVLTLGFAPLTPDQAGEGLAWALPVNDAMAMLFRPAPALFAAGMIAYLISQYHDIWLYSLIRRMTGGRRLWLRNTLSTSVSALLDNVVFSVLAWVVFARPAHGVAPAGVHLHSRHLCPASGCRRARHAVHLSGPLFEAARQWLRHKASASRSWREPTTAQHGWESCTRRTVTCRPPISSSAARRRR